MMNSKKKLNRKGFTLIELIGVIVLLALIMGIGTYSIVEILNNYKDKSYDLLIENIKSAVEEHYIECEYDGGNTSLGCDQTFISLEKLVKNGYLESNSETKLLIDPRTEKSIKDCEVQGKYKNGIFSIVENTNNSDVCPEF